MTYTYHETSNKNQYADVGYGSGSAVEARYIASDTVAFRGNPLIEALPPPRTEETDIALAYSRGIPGYRFRENNVHRPKTEILKEIAQLRSVRSPLPFYSMIEQELFRAMIAGYAKRYIATDHANPLAIRLNGETVDVTSVSYSVRGAEAPIAFQMVGCAGVGKTSALAPLLEYIPQVIMHLHDNSLLLQIPVIMVSAFPHSNMGSLFESIGHEVDKLLGYIHPFYEDMIKRCKDNGKKAAKVRELIELFSIGIILIDEIQWIDFRHTQKDTFDLLTEICNASHCPIGVIGTEEAREKMLHYAHSVRRIGSPIEADLYCKDYFIFERICRNMIDEYQWYDRKIIHSEDVIKALYDVTHGTAFMLCEVYAAIILDYLDADPYDRPEITGEYVRDIAEACFHDLSKLVDNSLKMGEKEPDIADVMQHRLQKAEREAMMAEAASVQNSAAIQDNTALLQNIISTISLVTDAYSEVQIRNAFLALRQNNNCTASTAKEWIHEVMEFLGMSVGQKKHTKSQKKKEKKQTVSVKLSDLTSDEGEVL